ncbi:MAG TPA: DNA polymerase III subunit delta' [Caulobacteraceae bacterium]|jgi:DNA polymerase-3 subunit delta'|nr:DNA polymerase III subunit delta' [Caulobacteraceae bacterium]
MAEDLPAPRDVYDYERGDQVEGAFLEALARGRLHHAWLLTGPEGVGKATFAYRAARRLLGAKPDPAFGLLGSSPDDPENRLIAAQSHPDLMTLERAVEDGKTRKYISVDDARALPGFFAKTPSRSPYRVAIVDAADDMNANAANALLKTLEEPPERGVLLLVSHAPGRLVATIRSRCRRLAFAPWPTEAVADFVARRAGLAEEDAHAVAQMAKGAPGRALRLAEGHALEFDGIARDLVLGAPPADNELLALADSFRGQAGQGRFELFLERLAEALRLAATAPRRDPAYASRLAEFWDKVADAPGEADAVNLDRADMFWTLLAELRSLRAQAPVEAA